MTAVDAPALREVLLRTSPGAAVETRLLGTAEGLHSPHLLDVEVTQVIRGFELTEALDAPHLTHDRRLAVAARRHARVELV